MSGGGARVVATREATLAEWREAHAASTGATFFHGPEWSEIWCAYTRGAARPAPRRVEFADGRSAVLGLTLEPGPAVRGRRLPVRRFSMSPAGNYGGWSSRDALGPSHVEALTGVILGIRGLVWRQSPTQPAGPVASLAGAVPEVTYVIDLRHGAEEAHARWHRRPRQYAASARRAGVTVREARTLEDWMAYDALYRAAMRRWAAPSSVYDRSLFEILHGRASPHVRLWLAWLGDRPVAGELVFTAHRHAVSWHAAARTDVVRGAAHLLSWEIIAALAGEGFMVHDLNPSGGHAGATSYKESIGAQAAQAPLLVRRHPVERLLAAARRGAPRSARP
ncbi:MAG: GNAT family N-acetyltransferase [Actinomycetota bacterium]